MPSSSVSRPGAALLAAVLALSGCSSVRTDSGRGISVHTQGAAVPAVKEAGEKEAYEKGVRAFEDIPVAELLRRLEKGWSGTLFFGFADCPWCRAVLPAIIRAAGRTGQDVCYVRVRDSEGKLLYTETQRRQLAGAIGGYMKSTTGKAGSCGSMCRWSYPSGTGRPSRAIPAPWRATILHGPGFPGNRKKS